LKWATRTNMIRLVIMSHISWYDGIQCCQTAADT
jgi:hypothetical protein